MRSVRNLFGILAGLLCFSVFAQDELIIPDHAPKTDGLFDEEELEPIDEPTIVRPNQPADNGEEDMPPPVDLDVPNLDSTPSPIFRPSPSRTSNSSKPSSNVRRLPPLPAGSKDVPNPKEKLRMDFVQVDIEEIVKYFAERLRKKFIYDPSILAGKVTIISPTEVTLEEAWGAFLSAMEVRGYTVYPAGSYLKIERSVNARKSATPVYTDSTPNDDMFVTRLVTLKYLAVADVRDVVRNLVSAKGGGVLEHAPTNTLIISDFAYNVRRIIRILNVLDVEGFQEKLVVVKLKNASATDVAAKINQFFPTGTSPTSAARTTVRTRTPTRDTQGVIQKVVADERTNSIILLGSDRGIEQVRDFIAEIDVPVEGGGGQIHVYPLQNVKAEELAQTLSALASGQSTSRRTPAPLPAGSNIPTNTDGATTANLLGGDVRITADVPTNSLIIQASPRDFEILKVLIQKLDIRRRQVFIESAILETKVSKGNNFGIQASGPFYGSKFMSQKDASGNLTQKSAVIGALGGVDLGSLLANPSGLTGLALGFRSGSTYTISVPGKDGGKQEFTLPLLSAILKISASDSNINVISTPHILATANEEATISIGDEIPQVSGTTISSGLASTSIQRIPVLTELVIKPQINADDYLTLEIKQTVDQIGAQVEIGEGQKATATRKRSAKTTAIVKDQQTIVMGGLMEDRKTETISKVPVLGDIPLLGWLFKNRSTEMEKTNLLLFLTPYIIRDTADQNNSFFRKLRERERFLKEIGLKEKREIPLSGFTEEELKALDPEYLQAIKEMRLDPLPSPKPKKEENVPAPEEMPAPPPATPALPQPEPEPTLELGPDFKPPAERPTLPQESPALESLPLEDSPPETMVPLLKKAG